MLFSGPERQLKRIATLAAQTPERDDNLKGYYEHLEQIRSLMLKLTGKLPASALPLIQSLLDKFGAEIAHCALHALSLIDSANIEQEILNVANRFGCNDAAFRILAPRNPAKYFPKLSQEQRFITFVDAIDQQNRTLQLEYLALSPEGINLRNDCNQSLLWYVISSKNQETARFLLEQDIDVEMKDVRGETIFDYCRERVTYQRCAVSQWFLEEYGPREHHNSTATPPAATAPSSSARVAGEEFYLYALIRRMESNEWLPTAEGETLNPATHSVCYRAYQEAKTLNKPEQLQALCRLIRLGVLSPRQLGLAGFLLGGLLSRFDDADSRALLASLLTQSPWPETTLIGLLRGARLCKLEEAVSFVRDCLHHESYAVRAEACACLVDLQDRQGVALAGKLVESGRLRLAEAKKIQSLDQDWVTPVIESIYRSPVGERIKELWPKAH